MTELIAVLIVLAWMTGGLIIGFKLLERLLSDGIKITVSDGKELKKPPSPFVPGEDEKEK